MLVSIQFLSGFHVLVSFSFVMLFYSFHCHAYLVILHLCLLSFCFPSPSCAWCDFIHIMLLHVPCINLASSPLLFPFLSFISQVHVTFSFNVHLLPINLSACPEPLCQISAHLKLSWLGSKMPQV